MGGLGSEARMMDDPLSQLRDWHLPAAVSWWPPAPGWWLLTLLLLAGLAAALIWWRRARHSPRAADRAAAALAREELTALRRAFEQDRNAQAFAAGVSRILRRLALRRFARGQVAGLTGQAWLAFLDQTGGTDCFCSGAGQLLTELAYSGTAPDACDADAVLACAEIWIRAGEVA